MKTTIWTLSLTLGMSLAAVRTYADDMTATNAATAAASQGFVTQVSWANDKEIALGQLALDKSQNPAVTNFAAQMIRDHTRIADRLDRIADREGLTYVPTNAFSPDNWQEQDIENFKGMEAEALMTQNTTTNDDLKEAKYMDSLSGAGFDKEYANCAVMDHTNAVQLFTAASQSLQDKQLKRFATRTLPVLRDHYDMAVMMQNEVSTNAP